MILQTRNVRRILERFVICQETQTAQSVEVVLIDRSSNKLLLCSLIFMYNPWMMSRCSQILLLKVHWSCQPESESVLKKNTQGKHFWMAYFAKMEEFELFLADEENVGLIAFFKSVQLRRSRQFSNFLKDLGKNHVLLQ